MKCKVFTEERYIKLLEDRLTPEESVEVREHLREDDCEECDEFFMSLEGEYDRQLHVIFNKLVDSSCVTVPSMKDVESEADVASDRTGYNVKQPSRWRHWLNISVGSSSNAGVWTGAAALLVLAVAGILQQLTLMPVAGSQRIAKGEIAHQSSINLTFATSKRDHSGNMNLSRGMMGGVYDSNDTLILHYQIPSPGYVYVVGYHGNKSVELLFPQEAGKAGMQSAGDHTVAYDDTIRGIPLDGLHGRYIIIGIYSPKPLDPEEQVLPLVQHSASSMSGPLRQELEDAMGDSVAVDVVYFDVRA